MLSTLTHMNTFAADNGVLASHRGGEHRGGGFFFLLLIVGLTAGAVYLIRRRRNGDAAINPTPPPAPPTAPANGARALLDERFAKGEIDQAEYEHRRAVLAGESTAPVNTPEAPTPGADEAAPEDDEASK